MSVERRTSRRLKDAGIKSMKDASDSDESGDEQQPALAERPSNVQRPAAAGQGRKPRAPKAPAPGGTGSALPPPTRPVRRAKKDSGADLHGLSLMEVLGKHAEAVPRAAKELVQEYQEDAPAATARVMTLIVHTAGYDEEISKDDVEEGEVDDLVKNMAQYVIQNQFIDPLHDKRLRGFPAAYQRFWLCLMSELHAAGLALEDYLVERLSSLVISLSCSPVQMFRLAGTLTASYIMSGWVKVQKLLARDLSQTQFQMDAESKKRSKNTALLDSLKRQLDQHHRQSRDLETMTKNLITSVFAVRFRDSWGAVRAAVIRSFADWIDAAPEAYLSDGHLKYLGWALSDQDAGVRLEAVAGVSQLYKSKDNVLGLRDFKVRFEARMREMLYDVDEAVVVRALGLLARLLEVDELDQDAIRDDVYELLSNSSETIRVAAAELVSRLLLDAAAQHAKTAQDAGASGSSPAPARHERKAARGAKAKRTQAGGAHSVPPSDGDAQALRSQLVCLLDLLGMLARHNGSASSASAGDMRADELSRLLNAHIPVLSDVRMLTAALLDDDLLEQRGACAAGQLVALLSAAVTRNAADADADAASALSVEVASSLPRLLGKHQADAHLTCGLLRQLHALRIDAFALLSSDGHAFGALLASASDALQRHAHDRAAVGAAVAVLVACAEGAPGALQQPAQLALAKAVSRAAEQLVAATDAVRALPARELQDQVVELASLRPGGAEQLYRLQCALVRVCELLRRARALASMSAVYDALDALLEDCLSPGRRLGSTVTALATDATLNVLSWAMVSARSESALRSGGAPQLDELRQRNARFLGQLCALYPPPEVADGDDDRGMDEDASQALSDDDEQLCVSVLACLSDAMALCTGNTWADEPIQAAVQAEAPDDVVRALWRMASVVLDAQQRRIDATDEELGNDEGNNDGEGSQAAAPSPERHALLQARAEGVASQLGVVSLLSQLLSAPAVLSARHFRWLAAHMVSRMVAHGPEVEELVRDVVRGLRVARPAIMPEVYMGAMKLTFRKVLEAEAPEEGGDGSDAIAPLLQDFSDLSKRLAQMYVGHNLHREELVRIARAGLAYAVADAPSNVAFAAWGLGHFTGKLAPEDAATLVGELEQAAAGLAPHDPDDEAWVPLYQYLGGLKDRMHRGKGPARGAIKGARAAAAAAPRPRKISFAADGDASTELPPHEDGEAGNHSNSPGWRADAGGAAPTAGGAAAASIDGSESPSAEVPRGAAYAMPASALSGGSLHHAPSADGSSGLELGAMDSPGPSVEPSQGLHAAWGGQRTAGDSGSEGESAGGAADAVQEASQATTGGIEPPPRLKRRRRI